MGVGTADDVLLVTVRLASLHHRARRFGGDHFVHVNLNCAVPPASDNSVIFSTVTDERNFAVGRDVPVQLLRHDARLEVVDLQLALVAANHELAVVLIKHHLGDVCREDILNDSDGLSSLGVPNLDVFLASHENFKSLLTESSAANRLVVCVFG